MLKKFIVSNFLSYKDETILDLTAGKRKELESHTAHNILKSSILYGANASGKSNIIKAISFAKAIIVDGFDSVETYKKYFRLDYEYLNKPTNFEFEIFLNNKLFSYGISLELRNKTVLEEWLYRIDTDEPEMYFERKYKKTCVSKTIFEDTVLDRLQIYAEDIARQNRTLFLSDVAKKELENLKIVNQIWNWFDTKLAVLYPDTKFDLIPIIARDKTLKDLFKKYLQKFDTGIVDIANVSEDYEEVIQKLPKEIRLDIEKENFVSFLRHNETLYSFIRDDKDILVEKLVLQHRGRNIDNFELQDESDGTKRLFDFIPLIPVFEENFTIIIDEFDRSLHPNLTRKFFEIFYKLSEDSKSQLIVSAHESTLLNLDLVRRDEINLIEKDDSGASKIVPFRKFESRFDSKLEKAYLLGRFGAVPYFRNLDGL
jgi:AAA15 family ATPase/GTPase